MILLQEVLPKLKSDASILKKYYQDTDKQYKRIEKLVEAFKQQNFGDTANVALFSTPGRTEMAGNHTDHNLGEVIAASVELDLLGIIKPRTDNLVKLYSLEFGMIELDLDSLEMREDEKESSTSLIRGIAARMQALGGNSGGFEGVTQSNVLSGSGLSSSATFEIFIGTIFNHFYNKDSFSLVELAQIAQFAENKYFGKPCGLMDQLACAFGGIIHIDFQDPITPQIEQLGLPPFLEDEYQLVIIDTGADHAQLTDAYAAIPAEMLLIAAYFNKKSCREISKDQFYQSLKDLRSHLQNDRAILRVMHFLDENERVKMLKNNLVNNRASDFFSLVKESGYSSYQYLQNVLHTIDHREQSVGLYLGMCAQFLSSQGAFRVHGGGFAGTIQAYVAKKDYAKFVDFMSLLTEPQNIIAMNIRKEPASVILS